MKQQKSVKHPWLMILRGVAIGLIGVLLFSFTAVNHTSAYGIGAALLVSGATAIWFGLANRPTQEYASWLIWGGLLDGIFGVAALFYADGSLQDITDLIGFWALIFAILQAVQAIYSYIGPSGTGFDLATKLIHVVLVGIALWLAYALLMVPGTGTNSVGMTGLLPIFIGVILIMLSVKQRSTSMVNAPLRQNTN